MEQQLKFGISLLRQDIIVRFIGSCSDELDPRDGEIYVDKSKLESCPSELRFTNYMQKKIGRSDQLKSKTHTLGLCVLLLASKGYCITSSQMTDIEDKFIERCWESMKVVSDNVPQDMSNWIKQCMDGRSSPKYSMLFCQAQNHVAPIDFLGTHLSGKGQSIPMDMDAFNVPHEIWHRNDVAYQTLLLHTRLGHRNLSDNGE